MLILMILVYITLLTFITYVYLRWLKLKQYWAKRRVPYIPPYPLVGNMAFLQKENPTIWFRRIYNDFKEPYVGIWRFWRPALIINSSDIAKNILIRDQANFRNRMVASGNTDPVGRLNLFTLDDPLWRVIRKHLTFFFTGSKLRGIQTLITKKAMELVERIDVERQKKEPINLRSVMTDFATDVMGTASFGVVSDATLTGESLMRNIIREFVKFDFFRGLAWSSVFFLPEVTDLFRVKMFPTKITEFMRKILRMIIAQRGGYENKVTEPRDLLDVLIKIKQDSGEELDMTENMILAQATVFLLGGVDTTATALAHIIYELAYSPELQNKLYEELLTAKDEYEDDLLDASVLSQLNYLNCVINEGFRKYPCIAWLDRVALNDYKVEDHLTIEAGTVMYVNIAGLHYDPEIYPEPHTFNPDRFLPENKNSKSFAYLPFGEGPRKCIGQRFGLSNMRHALTALMLHYEVRPLPDAPKPQDIQLKKEGLITVAAHTLSVEFIPRK